MQEEIAMRRPTKKAAAEATAFLQVQGFD